MKFSRDIRYTFRYNASLFLIGHRWFLSLFFEKRDNYHSVLKKLNFFRFFEAWKFIIALVISWQQFYFFMFKNAPKFVSFTSPRRLILKNNYLLYKTFCAASPKSCKCANCSSKKSLKRVSVTPVSSHSAEIVCISKESLLCSVPAKKLLWVNNHCSYQK